MHKRLTIALTILLTTVILNAFNPTRCTAQIIFHRYDQLTTKNGLSANHITALAEDEDGFLWIGTREGLNRYDGHDFLKFYTSKELPSNDITSICTLSRGQIAIGCGNGLCVLNPHKLAFQKIELPQINIDRNKLGITYISQSPKGDIWVATTGGIIQYTSGFTLKRNYAYADSMLGKYNITNLCTTGNNGVWGITNSRGALFADEKTGQLISKKISELSGLPLPKEIDNCNIASSRQTGSINSFILRNNEHIYHVETDNNSNVISNKVFETNAKIRVDEICYTYPINDTVWLANPFYGHVMLYNPLTTKRTPLFENKVAQTSWPDGRLVVYKKTSQGIWCGTSEGLYFFYKLPQGIERYAPVEKAIADLFFNSGVIDVVYTAPNKYLVSLIGYGLGWWDGKNNIQLFSLPMQFNKYNVTRSMEKTSDDFLILHALNGDVGSYNLKTNTVSEKLPFVANENFTPRSSVTCRDHNKTTWAVWRDTLFEIPYGSQSIIAHPIIKDSADLKYTCIDVDAENVWIGVSKKAFIKYTISSRRFQQINVPYYNIGVTDKISQWSVTATKSKLFIVTNEGLFVWQPGTPQIKQYKKEDGLSSLDLTSTLADLSGNVWIGTSNGLNYINADNGQLFSFYTEDGLVEDNILNLRQDEAHPENILVCSQKSLCIINPRLLLQHKSIPRTIITDVRVNNERYSLNSSFTLPYNHNNISFQFTGILFGSGSQKNQYAYKLQGIDSSWKKAGSEQVANYLNLPPGQYSFNVRSASPQGFWNDAVPVTFTITPPFYRTTLFYVLLAATVIGLLVFAFWLQRQRLESRGEEKRKITQEISNLKMTALRTQLNPHFIFNALNSIQYFVLDNQATEASKYLSKFAKLFRLVLDNADSNFIPLNKEMEWLQFYIDIEALRCNNSFTNEFIVDERIKPGDIKIPSMLIQPHIENAILHGLSPKRSGGLLRIIFRPVGDTKIECLIEDNGIGREAAAKVKENKKMIRQSKGTSLVTTRIELLRTEYNYQVDCFTEDLYDEEKKGRGTIVHLVIPIHSKT